MAASGMGSAMALAKSTLAPRIYKTGPPNYYTQTSFSKRLDVVGNLLAACFEEYLHTYRRLFGGKPTYDDVSETM